MNGLGCRGPRTRGLGVWVINPVGHQTQWVSVLGLNPAKKLHPHPRYGPEGLVFYT